jgi:hypothetical protein
MRFGLTSRWNGQPTRQWTAVVSYAPKDTDAVAHPTPCTQTFWIPGISSAMSSAETNMLAVIANAPPANLSNPRLRLGPPQRVIVAHTGTFTSCPSRQMHSDSLD